MIPDPALLPCESQRVTSAVDMSVIAVRHAMIDHDLDNITTNESVEPGRIVKENKFLSITGGIERSSEPSCFTQDHFSVMRAACLLFKEPSSGPANSFVTIWK